MPSPKEFKPIAIVGIACRLPQADGIDEYWKLLIEGRNAITPFPPDRMDRELYFDSQRGIRGKTYSQVGGFIPERPIDRDLVGLSEEEYQNWDECHLIFAEVACSALRNSGNAFARIAPNRKGVYVGHSGGSRQAGALIYGTLAEQTASLLDDLPQFEAYPESARKQIKSRLISRMRQGKPIRRPGGLPNLEASSVARLVSQVIGSLGPQMTIDAACASSLVALDLASMAIQNGEIDAAIVGGASYNKCDSMILFSQAQSCSATGSRPFDEGADGLISSEGYVAIAIKSLEQAQVDGDRIWAVIRGIGLASDGRGKSLWAPRREGQLEAMQRAYAGGIEPGQIQYIEAHATSTQVGDATEMKALADMFAIGVHGSIPIGSVKSNIGHTLETAGLASLLKGILAMHHGMIPPTINLKSPNQSIPWSQLPFYVPSKAIPWKANATGKRIGAVNAFGIGGLNVHVVIESPDASVQSSHGRTPQHSSTQSEPIAIVGRGVIVPGANGIDAFQKLLASGTSQTKVPPQQRWRHGIGIRESNDGYQPGSVYSAQGGFLTDYAYDWRLHRVPPKQVDRANPLQFMLLDAASQALAEAGIEKQEEANNRISVVVGTIFGGEFGHQLQLGLRIEELRRDLVETLLESGVSRDQSEMILDDFESRFFEVNPALYDETGSFTSSTLASRITKQFNLMGGAMAIDAGDCSSSAALSAACNLLRTQHSDMVLCASGQRSMDLASLENYQARGWMVPELPRNLPGEGVAVFALMRLSDAKRSGRQIFGIIDGIEATQPKNNPIESIEQLRTLIGDLKGTQAAAGLLATLCHSSLRSTISPTTTSANHGTTILDCSDVGLAFEISVRKDENQTAAKKAAPETVSTQSMPKPQPSNTGELKKAAMPSVLETTTSRSAASIFCEASSLQELQRIAGLGSTKFLSQSKVDSHWSLTPKVRCAIVYNEPSQLDRKLFLLANCTQNDISSLSQEGIFVSKPEQRRAGNLAIAFPGQGSQKPGFLESWSQFIPDGETYLQAIDRILMRLCKQSSKSLATEAIQNYADAIWAVQANMVISNSILARLVKSIGIVPRIVFGHSLGELSAIEFAEAWSIEDLLEFTYARSKGVELGQSERGGLLSIHADGDSVQRLLKTYAAPIVITHYNAPSQTVVGGPIGDIQTFAGVVERSGLNCSLLTVPAAFHTPMLAGAQSRLAASVRSCSLQVPTLPILSSVTNQFVIEPMEIRRNLLEQLVTPLDYTGLLERSNEQKIDVILEIGPGQVLTKFHRATLGSRAACLWSIGKAKDESTAIAELKAIASVFDLASPSINKAVAATSNIVSTRSSVRDVPASPFFDATANRRMKKRLAAESARYPGPVTTAATTPVPTSPSTASSTAMPDVSIVTELQTSQNQPIISYNGDGHKELEVFLKDFIVEHTGYPADMIELDWDLEADLGIDSIKQAQLFGELREMFEFEPRQLMAENVRTLRQLINFLSKTGGKREWIETTSNPASLVPSATQQAATIPQTAQVETPILTSTNALDHSDSKVLATQNKPSQTVAKETPNSSSRIQASRDELASFMIDFVVEHTGYPNELVDLDSEFEADLGLDSIKIAQLFGELRSHFGLQLDADLRKELIACQTMTHLLDVLTPVDSIKSLASASQLASSSVQDESIATEVSTATQSVAKERTVSTQKDDVPSVSKLESSERPLPFQSLTGTLEEGIRFGQLHQKSILDQILMRSDARLWANGSIVDAPAMEHVVAPFLQGIAIGAGVHEQNLVGWIVGHGTDWESIYSQNHVPLTAESVPAEPLEHNLLPETDDESTNVDRSITRRYLLSIHPAPIRSDALTTPQWQGAACILGNNRVADGIEKELLSDGIRCFRLDATLTPFELQQELERCWEIEPIMHLFLATGFDSDAESQLSPDHWKSRGTQGIRSPYWLCQKWIQKVVEAEKMHDATLVGLSTLGGDFGFAAGLQIHAAEGGAVAGLLKAIMIESWVNGYRAIPIKMLDFAGNAETSEVIRAIWHELANSSFDIETAWLNGDRHVVRATHTPLASKNKSSNPNRITKGGNWIFSGGGRGITAAVARRLAERFGIRLHLIGKSHLPSLPDSYRDLDAEGLKELKFKVMREARDAGKNSMTAWQDMEKVLEIDANMRAFARDGIDAHYYACDVSNPDELQNLVDRIRQDFGPIRGCVHGAGVGQDARFDRKRPEKVEQCISAKFDGSLALMLSTMKDPLECFIGFGSISGRFGANGHTDYSLANDVLAKVVGWYRGQRPEVPSTVFHWHAWGDIGMATKPETKLALEMIDMTFMPAEEGLNHLVCEIESGLKESEILITDDRYYRLFFPAETLVQEGPGKDSIQNVARYAFLTSEKDAEQASETIERVDLDPRKEVFLREHCLQNRPLLPIVVGLELMVEAGLKQCQAKSWAEGRSGLLIENLEALRGLRFFDDNPVTIELHSQNVDSTSADVLLRADFRARNGMVMERGRHYMRSRIHSNIGTKLFSWEMPSESALAWKAAKYPSNDQPFFVGPSFQVLKKTALDGDRVFGKILAPILVELAGSHRPAEGWQVPSAVIDACLFATGDLAWNRIRPGISLPVGMKRLNIRMLPEVGESCLLESRWKRSEGKYAWFDFVLWGRGQRVILEAEDYQICWLEANPS